MDSDIWTSTPFHRHTFQEFRGIHKLDAPMAFCPVPLDLPKCCWELKKLPTCALLELQNSENKQQTHSAVFLSTNAWLYWKRADRSRARPRSLFPRLPGSPSHFSPGAVCVSLSRCQTALSMHPRAEDQLVKQRLSVGGRQMSQNLLFSSCHVQGHVDRTKKTHRAFSPILLPPPRSSSLSFPHISLQTFCEHQHLCWISTTHTWLLFCGTDTKKWQRLSTFRRFRWREGHRKT